MPSLTRHCATLAFALGLGLAALCPPGAGSAAKASTLTVIGDVNTATAGNLTLFQNVRNGADNVLFVRGILQLNGLVSSYRSSGATLTERSAPLTEAALTGVGLLVVTNGYNSPFNFTDVEVALMRAYGESGGAILLVAEGNNANAVASYNRVLEGLGARIRFTGIRYTQSEVVTDIPETPLSAGLTSFQMSPHNTLSGGTLALSTANGPVIAFEQLGVPAPVPVPAALPLMAGALGALAWLRLLRGGRARRRAL